MSFVRPTLLLTQRALVQLPRLPAVLVFSMVPPLVQFLLFGSIFSKLPEQFGPAFPTDNYYEYLAPAIVLFTCIVGIANAGVALVNDFKTGYFQKVLLAPVNMWSILMGRLLSDGVRVYVQGGLLLLLSFAFGASVETGLLGALLMLLLGTLFAVFTVGVIVTNVALRSKSEQAVQAIFPLFFVLLFLTTAFLPAPAIGSQVVLDIIDLNPAQYVIVAMQDLMMVGWEARDLGVALAVIGAFFAIGVPFTVRNFRRVYS